MSQEQLSEQIGISVTHLSHIETGNTKLSLPVLVSAAEVLDVQTDELLNDFPPVKNVSLNEITQLLENCTAQQVKIITEIVRSAKIALDKYGQIQ